MAKLSIQQAIEQAKANPNSEFATQLRKAIESGQLDQAAQKQGVDLSVYGRPKPQPQGKFGSETVSDIANIGQDILASSTKRAENIVELGDKMRAGERSVVGTRLKQAGQLAGAGAEAIGAVVQGAVKTLIPQKTEEKLKEVEENLGEDIAQMPAVQNLARRYAEATPEQQEAIDALGGVLSLASEFVGAGAGGRLAQGVKTATQKVTGVVGDLAGKGVSKTVKTAGRIGAEMEGALTGTSAETFQVAFDTVKQGGRASEEFTKALRNQIEPETIAENARNAVQTVKTRQQEAFRNSFNPIKDTEIDTSGILNSFAEELEKANIVVKNGVLDFSQSKLRTTPQAMSKLQSAFDELKRIGETSTLEQIDTSRQALKGLRLSGDDASANLANKFIDDATRIVRSNGEKVEGYKQLLNDFATEADFIDQLERDLMTGNRRTIDQTYRRLTTTLKTNNEARMKLLQELDEATDGVLLSQIAGQQLSEVMPRGIVRAFSASLAGAGLATGFSGSGFGFAVIPMLLTASPRVMGEFVRTLGIGAAKTKAFIEAVDTAKKTLSKTYNVPVKDLGQLFGIGVVSTAKNNTEE